MLPATAWSEDGRASDDEPHPIVDKDDVAAVRDGRAPSPQLVWSFAYGAVRAFRGGQYSTVRLAAPARFNGAVEACGGGAPPLVAPEVELVVVLFFGERSRVAAYCVDAVRRTVVRCDPADPAGDLEPGVVRLAHDIDRARGWKATGVAWELNDALRQGVRARRRDSGLLAAATVATVASGVADVRGEACVSKYFDYANPDQQEIVEPAQAFVVSCTRQSGASTVVAFPPWLGCCVRRDDLPARLAFGDALLAAYGDEHPMLFVGAPDLSAAAAVPHVPHAFSRAASGAEPCATCAVPPGVPVCGTCLHGEGASTIASLVFPCGLAMCSRHVAESAHLLGLSAGGERVSHSFAPCEAACGPCHLKLDAVLSALAPFAEVRARLTRTALEKARFSQGNAAAASVVEFVLDRADHLVMMRCPNPACDAEPFGPELQGCGAAFCGGTCNTHFCAGCGKTTPCAVTAHNHVRFCRYLDVVRPPSGGDEALYVSAEHLSVVHSIVATERIENLLSAFPADVVAAVRAHPRFHAAEEMRRVAGERRLLPETSARAVGLRRMEELMNKHGHLSFLEVEELKELEPKLCDRREWELAY